MSRTLKRNIHLRYEARRPLNLFLLCSFLNFTGDFATLPLKNVDMGPPTPSEDFLKARKDNYLTRSLARILTALDDRVNRDNSWHAGYELKKSSYIFGQRPGKSYSCTRLEETHAALLARQHEDVKLVISGTSKHKNSRPQITVVSIRIAPVKAYPRYRQDRKDIMVAMDKVSPRVYAVRERIIAYMLRSYHDVLRSKQKYSSFAEHVGVYMELVRDFHNATNAKAHKHARSRVVRYIYATGHSKMCWRLLLGMSTRIASERANRRTRICRDCNIFETLTYSGFYEADSAAMALPLPPELQDKLPSKTQARVLACLLLKTENYDSSHPVYGDRRARAQLQWLIRRSCCLYGMPWRSSKKR